MKNYRIKQLLVMPILLCLFCGIVCGEEQLTQGEFVVKIVNFLKLEYRLPGNASINDYANLLKEEGFTLPEKFNPSEIITKEEKAALLSQLIDIKGTAKSKIELYRDRAVIEKINGNVFVKYGSGKEWVPAELNMSLTSGDYIKTDKNSDVWLRVGVIGRVVIKENTELLLKELSTKADKKAERILMYLAYGEIIVDGRYIERDSTLETLTPTTLAAVRGTVYRVKVSPVDNKTEINDEF